jgi:RNA polymerase sigma-70 factor, ECF subfamily
VALTAQDRNLLRRCLNHESGAWNDFVDRYLGLVYHVIQHTSHLRSQFLQPEETEDIAADIMSELANNDYAVLRQFRGNSSLASFLTVIARRSCVNDLARRHPARDTQVHTGNNSDDTPDRQPAPRQRSQGGGLEALEEVGKLLKKLPARERKAVQLYFIEGRTYEEISTALNIPINHIGAILTRARKKLRADTNAPPPRVDPNHYK